jgi:hypothetical protein
MGVQLDLLLPPIIVGMLIIIIFQVNSFMMDSSIDSRVYNDMQSFAETSTVVLDDLLRRAKSVNNPDDFEDDDICNNFRKQDGSADTNCSDELEFITTNNFKVTIKKDDDENNILISRVILDADGNEISGVNTRVYSLYVSKLEFQHKTSSPNFISYKIETESNPDHHVQQGADDEKTVKGFAERKLFLRNLAI